MKDMVTARSPVNVAAKWATMVKIVTNVILIQVVKMVIAEDHGNATASK